MANFSQRGLIRWPTWSMSRAICLLSSCVCMLGSAATAAPSGVQLDDGPTIPIQTVFADKQAADERKDLVSDLTANYPVRTDGMVAGLLKGSPVMPGVYAQWLTQPLVLIADDVKSRRWLKVQGEALADIKAQVLVFTVESKDRMAVLRAVRADLPMAPALVPELVNTLKAAGAAVYPLVILTDGRVLQDVRHMARHRP